MMQIMKWILALFVAATLCAGSALAGDPVAPAGESASKEGQADHAGHAGKTSDAAAAGEEKQTDHTSHDMKCCMEMAGKKCMSMDGKGCGCCKDCMHGDGRQCDHHKGKKHKPHDVCDTKRGADKSVGQKLAEGMSEDKGVTSKPAAKAIEPVLSDAEGRALGQRSNCFACHSIEKKVVGPAWKDIAAKYRGDAGAEEKLVAKVSRGSSGTWGSVPMPANSPSVKDADIKALVKFTLSLK